MFTSLGSIASVNLGYKSLQNSFYYVNKPTVDSYGIEKRYLTPVIMMRDFDATQYEQDIKPNLWLFNCKDAKGDLRGTGALRYIEAMADRAAVERKQAGKVQTIREALEAQGGRLWYAPKATPNKQNIWLRKAFNSVYSPFLFEQPALVDQRCNSITAGDGIVWQELAAVLSSTLFAYSVEINGAASMGAGALEAPTTKLRNYPIFDVSKLKAANRKKLVSLAKAVWAAEPPIDWGQAAARPGAKLKALDQFLLDAAGRSLNLDRIYTDLHNVCRARIAVGSDKEKTTRKKSTESIGGVAESIARAILPKIQIKNFPDSFIKNDASDISFTIDRTSLKQINSAKMLGDLELQLVNKNGEIAYEDTLASSVAEAVVRAILWGRTAFSVSSQPKVMDQALDQFLVWADQITRDVEKAIAESALGTGYEESLKKEIYLRLGINPLAVSKILPSSILVG